MFCSSVPTDPKLSAQEKFHVIQGFRQMTAQPGPSAPQAATRGEQSPAVISKDDTSISYGTPAPAGTPHLSASDQAPPAGSVWTEGNQSPAVNSGGKVGTQYDTSSAAGERPLEMSSLGATVRRFMSIFIMLTCAGPLAAQQATATGNQGPAVNAGGNVTINYAGMTPDEKAVFTSQIADTILTAAKGKGASAVEPGAEQLVDQTITAIAK